MRRLVIVGFVAVVLSVCPGRAHADLAAAWLNFQCNSPENLTRLSVPPASEEPATDISLLTYDDKDCVLADGTTIRVKTNYIPPRHYMCSAAPELFFSLWVNHEQILSQQTYSDCEKDALDHVTVSAAGIEICLWKDSWVDPDRPPATCETRKIPKLGTNPDLIEYPDHELAAPPGSISLVRNEEPETCGAMERGQQPWGLIVVPPAAAQKVAWADGPDGVSWARFDILNEGNEQQASKVAIIAPAGYTKIALHAYANDAFAQTSKDSENARDLMPPINFEKMGDLILTPFILHNRTYILSTPAVPNGWVRGEPSVGIVLTISNREAQLLCEFDMVPEHY